jgi:hypothetical protein
MCGCADVRLRGLKGLVDGKNTARVGAEPGVLRREAVRVADPPRGDHDGVGPELALSATRLAEVSGLGGALLASRTTTDNDQVMPGGAHRYPLTTA